MTENKPVQKNTKNLFSERRKERGNLRVQEGEKVEIAKNRIVSGEIDRRGQKKRKKQKISIMASDWPGKKGGILVLYPNFWDGKERKEMMGEGHKPKRDCISNRSGVPTRGKGVRMLWGGNSKSLRKALKRERGGGGKRVALISGKKKTKLFNHLKGVLKKKRERRGLDSRKRHIVDSKESRWAEATDIGREKPNRLQPECPHQGRTERIDSGKERQYRAAPSFSGRRKGRT